MRYKNHGVIGYEQFYPLSNQEFDDYYKHDQFYKGCYANDKAHPKFLKKNGDFMIVNVDPSEMSGSHWFCLKKSKYLELFDSWDLPQVLLGDSFIKKLKRYKTIKFMPFAIQNEDRVDTTCGWHCISFINSGLSIEKYARMFEADKAGSFPEIERCNLQVMSSFLLPTEKTENAVVTEPIKAAEPEKPKNILEIPLDDLKTLVDTSFKEAPTKKFNKVTLRRGQRIRKQTKFLINEMK